MTRRIDGADVVIVGAGIIGCTIARLLALRGADVLVIDRDSPGRRATWAAGGMLSPLIESAADDPFFHLADRSFDLYPALVEAVERESGMSVDYRTSGKLQCALDSESANDLRKLYDSPRAQQYGLRLFDGAEARAFQPGLSDDVQSALFVERDHRVDNRLFAQAIAASATAVGARIMIGVPVAALDTAASRVTGVRLASDEHVEADRVVLAAGAWSALIDGLPTPLPVAPVRGQMLAVDTNYGRIDDSPMFERVVGTEECYMIPRSDGRLVIGATVEHVGFDAGPTPEGIAWLIDAARTVMPGIAALPLIETWAGYRPGTPDDWPIIGADPALEGLVHASGHYRNGILLAPVTAEAVASIVDGDAPQWIEPFGISRFGEGS
jgi:glycine oxidase